MNIYSLNDDGIDNVKTLKCLEDGKLVEIKNVWCNGDIVWSRDPAENIGNMLFFTDYYETLAK